MADFKTHLLGGAAVGGALSTWILNTGAVDAEEAGLLSLVAIIGGLLPDLDADDSIPLKTAFTLAGLCCALAVMFHASTFLALPHAALAGGIAFVSVRGILFYGFTRLTVHRGVFHSLPAALMCGLILAVGGHRGLDWPPLLAWFAGSSLAAGFVTHLLLDELYSVDLLGAHLKRSFGSALKLGDRDSLVWTLLLYGVTALLFVRTPQIQPFQSWLESHLGGLVRLFGK